MRCYTPPVVFCPPTLSDCWRSSSEHSRSCTNLQPEHGALRPWLAHSGWQLYPAFCLTALVDTHSVRSYALDALLTPVGCLLLCLLVCRLCICAAGACCGG